MTPPRAPSPNTLAPVEGAVADTTQRALLDLVAAIAALMPPGMLSALAAAAAGVVAETQRMEACAAEAATAQDRERNDEIVELRAAAKTAEAARDSERAARLAAEDAVRVLRARYMGLRRVIADISLTPPLSRRPPRGMVGATEDGLSFVLRASLCRACDPASLRRGRLRAGRSVADPGAWSVDRCGLAGRIAAEDGLSVLSALRSDRSHTSLAAIGVASIIRRLRRSRRFCVCCKDRRGARAEGKQRTDSMTARARSRRCCGGPRAQAVAQACILAGRPPCAGARAAMIAAPSDSGGARGDQRARSEKQKEQHLRSAPAPGARPTQDAIAKAEKEKRRERDEARRPLGPITQS